MGANLRLDLMDTMTNYEMWIAGTMVASVCARIGKGGIHENMGKCSPVCNYEKVQLLKPLLSLCRERWKTLGCDR